MSNIIITPKGKVYVYVNNGKKKFIVPSDFSGKDLKQLSVALKMYHNHGFNY